MSEIVGIETRLGQLCNDDETLLGYSVADETQQGYYVLVTRSWPHRELDDAAILSLRYAYMTKGDGGDGWVGGDDSSGAAGINMQVPPGADPAEFARGLATMWAGSAARLDRDDGGRTADPFANDMRELEE